MDHLQLKESSPEAASSITSETKIDLGQVSPSPAAVDHLQLKEGSPELVGSINSETKIDLGAGAGESDDSSSRHGSEHLSYRILKRVPKESSPTTEL